MADAQWILELVLVGLLAATLVHALRLERALGVLKRDRAALEELVAGFNASTRQAESGIERLREAADGAGRQLARQLEAARGVDGDLGFLIGRGEQLADRLDALVRAARPLVARPLAAHPPATRAPADDARPARRPAETAPETEAPPPLRSQAERDLMKALRLVR
jgi:hypothetical protein